MEVLSVAAIESLSLELCRENSKASNRFSSAKELMRIWRVRVSGFTGKIGNRIGEKVRGKFHVKKKWGNQLFSIGSFWIKVFFVFLKK